MPYDLKSIVPYLSPRNAGYHQVTVRQSVTPGEVLQIAPALLLLKAKTIGTLLEPFVIDWNDIVLSSSSSLSSSSPSGISLDDKMVSIVSISEDTKWKQTKLKVPRELTVLLPLAGSIGLMQRDPTNANCRLEVHPDPYNDHAFLFHVIATSSIKVGDIVLLFLPPPNPTAMSMLREELILTGQPTPPEFALDNIF